MRRILNKAFPYLMTAPALILFSLLVLWPLCYGAYTSFFRWDGMSAMKWVGTDNYKYLLEDEIFITAMKNTVKYALLVLVFKNLIGLTLALVVNQQKRLKGFTRTAIYMPVTFSYVVVGVLWMWIFDPNFGLLNGFLQLIGLSSWIQGWLSDPKIALYSVVVAETWKWMGYHMVLYLAGLQAIPEELYEAARLDGANTIQRFFKITIPQLNSTLVLNFVMALTGAFVNNYTLINVMTNGGPFYSTETAMTYAVRQVFKYNNLGKANAISIVLFLVVIILGFVQLKATTRDVYE